MRNRFSFSTLVAAFSIGVLLLMIIVVAAQNRKISNDIRAQNEVIKAQTDINQKFLRCILLIERARFETPEARIAEIDKCTVQSRIPESVDATPRESRVGAGGNASSVPFPTREVSQSLQATPQQTFQQTPQPPASPTSETSPAEDVVYLLDALTEPLPVVRRVF